MPKLIRRKELLELIEEGENLHCEFKLRFSSPEKIAKEIIAFANTSGGYILFGIDDDKRVIGVQSEKGESELIENAIRDFCEPYIEHSTLYFDIDGKEIVAVYFPESETKPHRITDYNESLDVNTALVYIRVNDKSVQAGKEMIRLFKSNSTDSQLTKYAIGHLEKMVFDHLEKFETISVKELMSNGNLSNRRASRTLTKMVRAGLLLIHTKDNGESYFTIKSWGVI